MDKALLDRVSKVFTEEQLKLVVANQERANRRDSDLDECKELIKSQGFTAEELGFFVATLTAKKTPSNGRGKGKSSAEKRIYYIDKSGTPTDARFKNSKKWPAFRTLMGGEAEALAELKKSDNKVTRGEFKLKA